MKAGGRIDRAGKLVTWLLIVLLILGLAGGAAYLVMKSRGMTFYAETEGEKIFGGAEKTLFFRSGRTYEFSVRALEGGEVNYFVSLSSNPANNFEFVLDGKTYRFSGADEAGNDYAEVFSLCKRTDGFSLTIPEGFTAEKAVRAKFGEGVAFQKELSGELAYFVITIRAGESSAEIYFRFSPEPLSLELSAGAIVF